MSAFFWGRYGNRRHGAPEHVVNDSSVAARASRVRARLLFVLLDAISVCAGYGLAEIIYFRRQAPANYWQHFALFLAVAVIVALTANHLFGLYERMWRHAGAKRRANYALLRW